MIRYGSNTKIYCYIKYSSAILICFFSLLTAVSCGSSKKQPDQVTTSLLALRSLKQLEYRCPRINHPFIEEAISRVMVRLEIDPLHTKVFVLDCKVPFSLVAGEGLIFISRGMLEIIPNEASLAFLLAHEAAHHNLGHLRRIDADTSYRRSEEEEADR